jgi:DMSO/TMAO reductase YedYZ molybdopterin-dependent catalytic subunit
MKQNILSTLKIFLIIGFVLASFSSALSFANAQLNDPIWKLNVSGLVTYPTTFTLTDLQAMPQTTVSTALICVDFPNTIVAQGNWTGVKLSTLLNQTGILPEAIKVAFYANDGYSTDLTIAATKSDNIILATSKDGAPLSEAIRLVVPGHWGYKWISQVVKIELVDYDFQGKWESVGYSDDGIITQTSQRNTHPYPSAPVLTTPTALPSPSPKETPAPSPPIPSINNSTSQSPTTQSNNLTSDNFNLKDPTTILSIVIIAIVASVLITIIKAKNNNHKNSH